MDEFVQNILTQWKLSCLNEKFKPNRPVKKIADLLKCTVKGKIIMQTFKLFKNIDTRLLSDLVIDNEFETSGYRITKERFIGLARELAEIFVVPPKTVEEAAKLFYYPFQKATAGHKCVSAGGILYDKYFNYRRKLIHCQLISPDEQQIEDTPIEFAEHAIKWLEVNDKPEQEVITKWNNTFHLRVPCKNVKNYFLQFKCLRSTFGHILLSYDFDTIYPNAKTKFKEEWDTVAPLIIRCAKSKNKLNPSDEELIEAGKTNILALFCLSKILGTILRKRKDSDITFGCLLQDVTNSFILHVKSLDDLTEFKNRRIEESNKSGNKIGPYVAIIGNIKKIDDEDEDEQEYKVFLIINDFNFEIKSNSVIEAIDYCFKSFFALKIDFSAECRHLWVFLQIYFYKIECQKVKMYTIVTKFINRLDELRNNDS